MSKELLSVNKPQSTTQAPAGLLQRKRAGGDGPETVPPIVNEVLRSPGQPLDAQMRAFFEPRFGHDFSRVRVHTDAKAAESARTVNALAYTFGENVVFGSGQLRLETHAGQRLLAHELAHVVQQRNHLGVFSPSIRHDSSLEADAEYASRSVHSDIPVTVARQSGLCLACANDPDPEKLSNEALVFEYERVRNWLNFHPVASLDNESEEHKSMRLYFHKLEVAAWKDVGKDILKQTLIESPVRERLASLPTTYPTIGVDTHPQQPGREYTPDMGMEARRQMMEDGELLRSSPFAAACYGVRRSIWGEEHGEAMKRARLMANVEEVTSAAAGVAQGKQQIESVGDSLRRGAPTIGMIYDPGSNVKNAPQLPNAGNPQQLRSNPEQPFIPVVPLQQVPTVKATAPQPQNASVTPKSAEMKSPGGSPEAKPAVAPKPAKPPLRMAQQKASAKSKSSSKPQPQKYLYVEGELRPIKSRFSVSYGPGSGVKPIATASPSKTGVTKRRILKYKPTGQSGVVDIANVYSDETKGTGTASRSPSNLAEHFPTDEKTSNLLEDHPTVPDDRPNEQLFNQTANEQAQRESRRERGNTFNAEREHAYPHNEVEIESPWEGEKGKRYRLDSYVPDKEIVSRKYPTDARLDADRAIEVISELANNYPRGARIADTPKNRQAGLAGKVLSGQPILEVPVLLGDVPEAALEYAKRVGVVIRDADGNILQ